MSRHGVLELFMIVTVLRSPWPIKFQVIHYSPWRAQTLDPQVTHASDLPVSQNDETSNFRGFD